ncbi:MAG: phosphotransferase [Chloroflexi bacterium]|nr:phosphotransferase [Chloroflexota bacterium]
MNWLDIDATLPTLSFAFDARRVAQHFEQHWSTQQTTAALQTTVKACRRQDVNYSPATRCEMTYTLSVEQAGSASEQMMPEQTIGVVEATPTDLHHRLFVADPQLPGLTLAVDGDAMRERFVTLRQGRGRASVVQACAMRPIRYKPGVRCAFRYELQTSSGQELCFGKLFARDSEPLWQTIVALYHAAKTESELPRIAKPLAYWPALPMVVQAAVDGVELHNVAFDAQIAATTRLPWLLATGRCSAALHTLTGVAGPQQTLAGDLAALDQYRPALHQVNPGLATRFEETLAAILTIARRQPELTPVLSHGALRTDQFMLENNQLVLIDLDSVCWASPARDLGNFLAYLTWKALRQPQHAAFIQRAEQAFLAGYQTVRTRPDAGWVALYQAASLLKIIGRRYTGLTVQEWPLTEALLDIAVRMIQT